jgi:hypothetical protein
MTTESETFLKAEESAQKLEQALSKLYAEAINYSTSTKELEAVRLKLIELIQSTQEISKSTHESVGILNSIGGPELVALINKVRASFDEQMIAQNKRLKMLWMVIGISFLVSCISLGGILIMIFK